MMNSVIENFIGYSVGQHYGYSESYRNRIERAIAETIGVGANQLAFQVVAEIVAKRALLIGMISRQHHSYIYQRMMENLSILDALTGAKAEARNDRDEAIALAGKCKELGVAE